MLGPYASPRKSQPSRGIEARNGSTWLAKMGVSTISPQRPTTMLGTAARRPISVESGPASQPGASSERKAAVPRPIGTTITMATAVVRSVPTTRMPAPYSPAAGFHVPDQRNPTPECVIAWLELPAMLRSRATTTAAKSPAPPHRKAV
jgi:hypothetical protein